MYKHDINIFVFVCRPVSLSLFVVQFELKILQNVLLLCVLIFIGLHSRLTRSFARKSYIYDIQFFLYIFLMIFKARVLMKDIDLQTTNPEARAV